MIENFLYLTLCCIYLTQGQATHLPSSNASISKSSPLPPPPAASLSSNNASSLPPPPSPQFIPPISNAYDEDQETINKTIEKYGLPKDFKALGLPGPELRVDDDRLLLPNVHLENLGNYTLKIRAITDYFSYNARYEEVKIIQERDRRLPKIKGQFGEHFERKSGGYYVRTIGYTLDENGYQQFLIDLTKAETSIILPEVPIVGGPPGAPSVDKVGISSTVLGTLIGGNPIG